jgi:hypothetical protein
MNNPLWNKYIGPTHREGICYNCTSRRITPKTFHPAPVTQIESGSDNDIRPVCESCFNVQPDNYYKKYLYKYLDNFGEDELKVIAVAHNIPDGTKDQIIMELIKIKFDHDTFMRNILMQGSEAKLRKLCHALKLPHDGNKEKLIVTLLYHDITMGIILDNRNQMDNRTNCDDYDSDDDEFLNGDYDDPKSVLKMIKLIISEKPKVKAPIRSYTDISPSGFVASDEDIYNENMYGTQKNPAAIAPLLDEFLGEPFTLEKPPVPVKPAEPTIKRTTNAPSLDDILGNIKVPELKLTDTTTTNKPQAKKTSAAPSLDNILGDDIPVIDTNKILDDLLTEVPLHDPKPPQRKIEFVPVPPITIKPKFTEPKKVDFSKMNDGLDDASDILNAIAKH